MFISKEDVQRVTGKTVSGEILQLAQSMIEVWVGKDEEEIDDGRDLSMLAKATAFQAAYIGDNPNDILEQAAVKQLVSGEQSTQFVWEEFGPFISPWAVRACKKLSWMGTRSVNTGKTLSNQRQSYYDWWVTT